MEVLSQKDSLVNEIKLALGSSFNPSIPVSKQLSDEQLLTIKANITSGIINGTISFKKEGANEKEIKNYVSGMVSNHLRKSKELNGGSAYSPSFTKTSDQQLLELNKLIKTYTEGSEEFTQIQEAIAVRKATIESEKVVVVKEKKKTKEFGSINVDVLPESLKNLAGTLVNQTSK